jgi:hypothetical protein
MKIGPPCPPPLDRVFSSRPARRLFVGVATMRTLGLPLLALLLTQAVGCSWMRDQLGMHSSPRPTSEVKPVTAEQLVGYLNTQASRLNSVTYGEARLVAREGVLSYTLRGNLAASQPRNFRMACQGGAMGGKVDLGSNPEQFWMYMEAPTTRPVFVFASHRDFEDGRAKLPGNIPFEPDWVMQALGMTHFNPALDYKASVQERDRTYLLSWPATTPTGQAIRKEIVFDADDAADPRPQVKKHLVRDTRGRVICSAEIKSARTFPVGPADPQTQRVPIVKYPTHIVLRWEEQKFEMDLTLDAAQVNQQLSEEQTRRLFSRPNIPGATPIDLARYEFPAR